MCPSLTSLRHVLMALPVMCTYMHLHTSLSIFQACKAVYDRIIDLRIATPQIIMNYGMFLEESNYFEDAFKVLSLLLVDCCLLIIVCCLLGHYILRLKVKGRRERLKRTWKKQVEEESVKVGLRRKDTFCRSKWIFLR